MCELRIQQVPQGGHEATPAINVLNVHLVFLAEVKEIDGTVFDLLRVHGRLPMCCLAVPHPYRQAMLIALTRALDRRVVFISVFVGVALLTELEEALEQMFVLGRLCSIARRRHNRQSDQAAQ